ncbi:hypothetical protein CN934_17895 [Ensifer sp. MMN_5]|nr:hypothetical protein CN934_17895 [Ensifer sp. MMN_5]RVQ05403.1 hypothetical protein CN070_02225 [Sinorhizobium meliloti]
MSRDEILDNITLYWLTNTATSSGRIYWENNALGNKIVIPAAVTVFPGEVYRPPKSWAARARTAISSTTTAWTGADISPSGKSRISPAPSCVPLSGPYVDHRIMAQA